MSTKSNIKAGSNKLYRLLMWSDNASMYVFGHCYYSLGRARLMVRAMYEAHGIIAVVYPL